VRSGQQIYPQDIFAGRDSSPYSPSRKAPVIYQLVPVNNVEVRDNEGRPRGLGGGGTADQCSLRLSGVEL
jgi:hypothetical protein